MPPWLPEPGYGDFDGERRLSDEEIGRIQRWVNDGRLEGLAPDLPAAPISPDGWLLGKPDLVVTMPAAYTLAAEGRDVYRNFVIPVPLTASRCVRGVELHPGNPKVVHHAFVKVDRTAESRRADAKDAEPGFPGMSTAAEMPAAIFSAGSRDGFRCFSPRAWPGRWRPSNDLVLPMHLNASGKPERVQASVGLYFTDQPPTNTSFKMSPTSFIVDIPAGPTNHVVEDSYLLPVNVQVLAVSPHAHYLAKEMQGWAILPDGTRRELLLIKQWDFNWQGDYRYTHPVPPPKGTTLHMRFT